ncbi:hypothetical protein [Thermococcus prieurii]
MSSLETERRRRRKGLNLPVLPGGRGLSPEEIEETINLGQGSEIAEEMRVKKTGREHLQILS